MLILNIVVLFPAHNIQRATMFFDLDQMFVFPAN